MFGAILGDIIGSGDLYGSNRCIKGRNRRVC